MSGASIIVQDLNVSYGATSILRDINVTIAEGEFVSIVGKSGCGKSTFLRALAGFTEFTGHVDMPSELGIVFQNYAVFPWMTVRENIAFGLHRLSPTERDAVVARHLEMVELTDHASKYPAQLSGGQTQKVAVARALAPNPKIIFMDEPFGALDTFTRINMQDWLVRQWESEHKTVLFVTHSIEEAIFLSDRVLLFGDGRICGEEKVELERPRKAEVKFSHDFVELRKKILSILAPDREVPLQRSAVR
jgi:ABC-type nitrate/sulfonate/bicarbonate transport system ATPase subunit